MTTRSPSLPLPRPAGRAARLALLALLPWLTHCATAPRLEGIEPSYAIPPGDAGQLDAKVRRDLGEEPIVSAVKLVEQNAMAFAYRAVTAAAAVRTLDVQYYIWHDDFTGRLLAAELMRAAERGVRVRVLIDDIDARAKHELFLVADLHPNLEVRVFNPFYSRSGLLGKVSEMILRGSRLNHRMHNKAWIADNRVAIVGGRNIGDEYFGASEHSNFSDLDLLLAGPIVADVSASFDEYWNSPNAVPVARFDGKAPPPAALDEMIKSAREYREEAGDTPYIQALRDERKRAEMLLQQAPTLKVGAVRLLVDDPSKVGTEEQGVRASNVLAGLAGATAAADEELFIVSPYFVPGKRGAASLIDQVARGLRVVVLTNSLAATDVAAVHTGYARYRRDLLRGGVELYEMKRKVGNETGRSQLSVTGSSGASLHTKAMIIDSRWVFVGSMNIDPRSANLNTEMGVLLESPELAAQLRREIDHISGPEMSYRVVLEEHEGLVWYDRVKGEDRRLEREPDASTGRRVTVTLLRLVPMESQL
ncbi:MAG: cardiolipin synthase [Pseudomonadota bacterium]|nr:cardiolipin synthase [Pseudomonadota bacterium]